MNRDEVIALLSENEGKLVRVTFIPDPGDPEANLGNLPAEQQSCLAFAERTHEMTVVSVDDEGFVNRIGTEDFWCTFDDVEDVKKVG